MNIDYLAMMLVGTTLLYFIILFIVKQIKLKKK